MFCKLGWTFSPITDTEEERLHIQKTGIDQMITPQEREIFTDKEFKYIAGEDKKWFTDDDDIYHYFLIEHDAIGKILKKICKKAGEDTVPLTSDDILLNYQDFEYAADGKLMSEVSFDAKDKKQFSLEYLYDEKGKKNKTIRYNRKKKKIRSVEFFYDDSGRLVRDVEYAPTEIEKYHRYEYDESGKMIRAMECHVKENGKGPDGIWFTDDDVVSSTKEFFYDDSGEKNKEKKYIGAGTDGVWFTDDDVLQYYVLFEYQK